MKSLKMIALVLIAAAMFPQVTQAAAQKPVTVYVQDLEVEFDQPPVINDGRVLVPFRQIAESMEVNVAWDQKTKLVTAQYKSQFKSKTVKIPVNSNTATVDTTSVKLDVPAKIINGRIMVPLRFLSQSFGAQVDWDSASREVDITYWQLKDGATTYNRIDSDNQVAQSYTEEQFDAKLEELYDNEELVITSQWTNLMDAGRIGIVSHHMGFMSVNNAIRQVSLSLDGELNASGKFDGSYYIELYDANTGDFVGDFEGELNNAAFDKIVQFNIKTASLNAGWQFG